MGERLNGPEGGPLGNPEFILKLARGAAGLTQQKAAQKIKIAVRTLSNYETGAQIPQVDVFSRLVALYGLRTIDELAAFVAGRVLKKVEPYANPEAARRKGPDELREQAEILERLERLERLIRTT